MKTIGLAALLIVGGAISVLGQSPAPTSARILTSQTSQAPRLPKYLVYRHFLAWIDSLDKQATAAGATDPYKFAEPFAKSARLSNDDVDCLRNEAETMIADLQSQDQKASAIITAFRANAKAAADSGEPLPPIPQEIHDFQRGRTALLVYHFVNLQAALSPSVRSSLDDYLAREFVPHLSAKRLTSPDTVAAASAQSPLSFGPQQ